MLSLEGPQDFQVILIELQFMVSQNGPLSRSLGTFKRSPLDRSLKNSKTKILNLSKVTQHHHVPVSSKILRNNLYSIYGKYWIDLVFEIISWISGPLWIYFGRIGLWIFGLRLFSHGLRSKVLFCLKVSWIECE